MKGRAALRALARSRTHGVVLLLALLTVADPVRAQQERASSKLAEHAELQEQSASQNPPPTQKPPPQSPTTPPDKSEKHGKPQGTPGLSGESVQTPEVEISGMYNFIRVLGVNCQGGSGSIAYNVSDSIGAVAEVGGCSDTGLPSGFSGHTVTYLFGPRLNLRSGSKFTPYVQVLAGGVQSASSGISASAFAATVGGGLDVRLNAHVSFRIAQAEYLLTRFGVGQQNNLRLGSGIVFRFGSK